MDKVKIEKLIPGGRGMARLDDGRVCFVWGALPSEEVEIEVTKDKSRFVEAVATKVQKPSKRRVEPKDEAFMSTSPWQILSYPYENEQKKLLIQESFNQQGIELPDFTLDHEEEDYHYRNKMEYSFWWTPETDQVDLAFHLRASRSKIVANQSSLAMPSINKATLALREKINELGLLARDMKSLVIRCDQKDRVVAALFVKSKTVDFSGLNIDEIHGLEIWYSNPKSPASVRTDLLASFGDVGLTDSLNGLDFKYDVHSFFQVNLPIYEQALADIRRQIKPGSNTVDMFSGVGSIGLSVGAAKLIEADAVNIEWAKLNAGKKAEVIRSKAEKADEYITANQHLILDPPRAGLDKKTVAKILLEKPKAISYLSCEASTHARDIKALIDGGYKIADFKAYNFFPRTPHTETLALLVV